MTLPTSLPDNFYKFFFAAALGCLGYFLLETEKNDVFLSTKTETYKNLNDELDIKLLELNHQKTLLLKSSELISKRYGVEDPIYQDDSMYVFNQIVIGGKAEQFVSDSLSNLWTKFKETQFQIDLHKLKVINAEKSLKEANEKFDTQKETNNYFFKAFIFLVFFGVVGLILQDERNYLNKRQEFLSKETFFSCCQSCGKKFSSMVNKGTNSDGTKNHAFCVSCFDKGEFVEPDLTVEEFLKRSEADIKSGKIKYRRKYAIGKLLELERWQKDDYF